MPRPFWRTPRGRWFCSGRCLVAENGVSPERAACFSRRRLGQARGRRARRSSDTGGRARRAHSPAASAGLEHVIGLRERPRLQGLRRRVLGGRSAGRARRRPSSPPGWGAPLGHLLHRTPLQLGAAADVAHGPPLPDDVRARARGLAAARPCWTRFGRRRLDLLPPSFVSPRLPTWANVSPTATGYASRSPTYPRSMIFISPTLSSWMCRMPAEASSFSWEGLPPTPPRGRGGEERLQLRGSTPSRVHGGTDRR